MAGRGQVRELNRRIRGVGNIAQVTKAMELVAAAKMRRAQERALASRPYSEKAWEILQHLSAQSGAGQARLLEQRQVAGTCVLLITADRGLAGAFNHNMNRAAHEFARRQSVPVGFIAVGRKGRNAVRRLGYGLMAEFTDIQDRPSFLEVTPIARVAISAFLEGEVDQVHLGYTRFVNTMRQEPVIRQILPVVPGAELEEVPPYEYEPDPETVLDTVLQRFTEVLIYQAVLESQASEHSARMVAMRNATENAKELVGELTLARNKARQEAETTQIMDIAGGAEALRQQALAR